VIFFLFSPSSLSISLVYFLCTWVVPFSFYDISILLIKKKKSESINSLQINWIVDVMITTLVSLTWLSCAKRLHACSTKVDEAYNSIELRSCNCFIAIRGWMSNFPGISDRILNMKWWLTFHSNGEGEQNMPTIVRS
jgi:hypothetical protein